MAWQKHSLTDALAKTKSPDPFDSHDVRVGVVTWSPDSKLLATATTGMVVDDGKLSFKPTPIQLWSVDGTRGLTLEGHTGPIKALAWSPDGKWLAARGLYETTVQLWHADGTAGPLLPGVRQGVSSGCSIAWSPDGGHLATAGSDGTVRFWEPDGTPGPVFEGNSVGSGARYVAWSPNSKLLAAAWSDRTIRLWAADGTPGAVLEGPDGNRNSIRWSPDSTRLAAWDTTGRDPAISLWFPDGTAIDVLKGHEDRVATVAWSPGGERLASASWDKTVRLWSARGEPGPVLKHRERVSSIAWSPDGSGRVRTGLRWWYGDALGYRYCRTAMGGCAIQ